MAQLLPQWRWKRVTELGRTALSLLGQGMLGLSALAGGNVRLQHTMEPKPKINQRIDCQVKQYHSSSHATLERHWVSFWKTGRDLSLNQQLLLNTVPLL